MPKPAVKDASRTRRAVNPAGAHEVLVDQEWWLQRLREALTNLS
jgi:hypothetical protein